MRRERRAAALFEHELEQLEQLEPQLLAILGDRVRRQPPDEHGHQVRQRAAQHVGAEHRHQLGGQADGELAVLLDRVGEELEQRHAQRLLPRRVDVGLRAAGEGAQLLQRPLPRLAVLVGEAVEVARVLLHELRHGWVVRGVRRKPWLARAEASRRASTGDRLIPPGRWAYNSRSPSCDYPTNHAFRAIAVRVASLASSSEWSLRIKPVYINHAYERAP